mmetsp:Transcript_1435/g.2632  ORF Transcript_1435/g.2632 Transcript_1435/m.2632 type:complete len:289 (+) Transcript_1435:1024-1890(+)
MTIVVRYQVYSKPQVAETSRTTNSVKIGLAVFREIKVDDHVYGLNINSSGEKIRSHQMSCSAVTELVEDTVSVGLLHLCMNVITGVAKFRNFLGQQFHAVYRVAKNDTLVDFQFGKESVEAMDLLPLLHIGIKLSDTSKGEFVHKINTVRGRDKLLAKGLDSHGEGSTEQADLVFVVAEIDNLLQDWLELGREKLVGFVHNDCFHVAQIGNLFRSKVEDTSRGCHNNVNRVVETHDIILQRRSAGCNHALHSHVFSDFFHNGRRLECQFSCGDQDQNLNIFCVRVCLF